jgi:hypothetical protein
MSGGDVVSDDLANEMEGLSRLVGCVWLHVRSASLWSSEA